MLNAGLSTLTCLKSRILPAASATDTTWDAALGKLGLATANRIANHCNRRIERQTAASDEFSAWNLSLSLRSYPVESITYLKIRLTDGTLVDVDSEDYSLDKAAGLVSFGTVPGTAAERIVATYAGGYWLDPMDGSTLPAGAATLPDDLLEIWIEEVQLQAEARGIFEALGLRSHKDASKAKKTSGLSESAIEGLRPYRRFSGE